MIAARALELAAKLGESPLRLEGQTLAPLAWALSWALQGENDWARWEELALRQGLPRAPAGPAIARL